MQAPDAATESEASLFSLSGPGSQCLKVSGVINTGAGSRDVGGSLVPCSITDESLRRWRLDMAKPRGGRLTRQTIEGSQTFLSRTMSGHGLDASFTHPRYALSVQNRTVLDKSLATLRWYRACEPAVRLGSALNRLATRRYTGAVFRPGSPDECGDRRSHAGLSTAFRPWLQTPTEVSSAFGSPPCKSRDQRKEYQTPTGVAS